MTTFSNVLHRGNSSGRGQNMGEFKQHIFKESPLGMRIIDSNLKLPFKRVLGLRADLPEGHLSFRGPRVSPWPGLFTMSQSSVSHADSVLPFMGHCIASGSFLPAPLMCGGEMRLPAPQACSLLSRKGTLGREAGKQPAGLGPPRALGSSVSVVLNTSAWPRHST